MNKMANDRIKRHFRNAVQRYYGFTPRITKYKGKIYISDPMKPSEPWEEFDNEKEGLKHYLKYT